MEILRWARMNGCPWNAMASAYAAAGGHLEVLRWMRANGMHARACVCMWVSGVLVYVRPCYVMASAYAASRGAALDAD